MSNATNSAPGAFEINCTPGLMKGEMRFRVYPSAGAFFFIKLDDVARPIMYGALWVMIARMMEKSREKKRDTYRRDLDAMSIKDRVESNPNNFRIAYAEIESSKIEQLSLLGLSVDATPMWKLVVTNDDGKSKNRAFTMPLPQHTLAGIPLIEGSLGQKHETLVEWDPRKKRFRKLKAEKKAKI